MFSVLATRIAVVAIWRIDTCPIQYSVLGENSTFLVDIESTKHCVQITLLHHGLTIMFMCKMMQTLGVLATNILLLLFGELNPNYVIALK